MTEIIIKTKKNIYVSLFVIHPRTATTANWLTLKYFFSTNLYIIYVYILMSRNHSYDSRNYNVRIELRLSEDVYVYVHSTYVLSANFWLKIFQFWLIFICYLVYLWQMPNIQNQYWYLNSTLSMLYICMYANKGSWKLICLTLYLNFVYFWGISLNFDKIISSRMISTEKHLHYDDVWWGECVVSKKKEKR